MSEPLDEMLARLNKDASDWEKDSLHRLITSVRPRLVDWLLSETGNDRGNEAVLQDLIAFFASITAETVFQMRSALPPRLITKKCAASFEVFMFGVLTEMTKPD